MRSKMWVALLLCFGSLPDVSAHAMMNRPTPRENRHHEPIAPAHGRQGPGCSGMACGWFSEGCAIGCQCNGKTNGTVTGQGGIAPYATPAMMNCPNPIEPTLSADSPLRTWNLELKSTRGDWTKYNPWRAPGSATPIDPCGVNTDAPGGPWPNAPAWIQDIIGNWQDSHGLGGRAAGYPRGFKGTDIKQPKDIEPAMWEAGSSVTVSFALSINHGGGYQYRVCRKSKDNKPTEECFQAHPLKFASNTSVIHWEDGSRPDETIQATDVVKGVKPVGSTWRRDPIPACNCDANDDCGVPDPDTGKVPEAEVAYENQTGYGPECPTGVQFKPLCEGCFGWDSFSFSIIDQVVAPSEPGQYMLSWRWDCEQSPQVWNSCADILVVAGATSPEVASDVLV